MCLSFWSCLLVLGVLVVLMLALLCALRFCFFALVISGKSYYFYLARVGRSVQPARAGGQLADEPADRQRKAAQREAWAPSSVVEEGQSLVIFLRAPCVPPCFQFPSLRPSYS